MGETDVRNIALAYDDLGAAFERISGTVNASAAAARLIRECIELAVPNSQVSAKLDEARRHIAVTSSEAVALLGNIESAQDRLLLEIPGALTAVFDE